VSALVAEVRLLGSRETGFGFIVLLTERNAKLVSLASDGGADDHYCATAGLLGGDPAHQAARVPLRRRPLLRPARRLRGLRSREARSGSRLAALGVRRQLPLDGGVVNQSRQDAFSHVIRGRLGSLAGRPSYAYLTALRSFVYEWLAEIEARMERVLQDEASAEQLAAELQETES
jgi:hypothetical protein